jgi:cardiolipin synthase A/B
MNSFHQIEGHTLTLLRNGAAYFPELIAAADAAVRSIYVETYIFANDGSGRLVSDALQRAARRGVNVHLLLDGFGSADFSRVWVDELRSAGVEVMWYRPQISWLTLRRQRLRRLHRKLAVVDGRVAFVGGINIIDDDAEGTGSPRLDYAVKVEGPVVERIHVVTRRLWLMVLWSSFKKRREREKLRLRLPAPAQHSVSFVYRDNLRHRHDIEQSYLKAIAGAEREVIIANAYFLPGRNFRKVMLDTARRGVRVVLMLQGRVDNFLLHYATLALYDELLKAGVEIHEYRTSFMHAKVAVIDGVWATVGSSNIDPFSLWLAREGNLVVHDTGFASTLRASLLQEMEHGARLVRHSVWAKKGFFARLLPRINYAVVRLLVALIGYASERDHV